MNYRQLDLLFVVIKFESMYLLYFRCLIIQNNVDCLQFCLIRSIICWHHDYIAMYFFFFLGWLYFPFFLGWCIMYVNKSDGVHSRLKKDTAIWQLNYRFTCQSFHSKSEHTKKFLKSRTAS